MEVPQKLVTELPQDLAISLLGIYPKKTNTLKHTHTLIQRDTYTPMFTTALFTIVKIWKQHKGLMIDE